MTGRTIAITGGMGFIGSHLAEAFLRGRDSVVIIDNLSTGCEENVAHLRGHPCYREIVGDVRGEASLQMMQTEADLIVHMAAAVGVRLTVEHPVETIETNVTTTGAVLQAARQRGAKVLLASTSEVYGRTEKVPYSEDDDLVLGPTDRPRWSYAASKITDELMALGCWQEFGLPVVVVRFFNIVGPRQSDRYVLPRFVRAALSGGNLHVHGDGSQTRSLTHIEDAVRAVLLLADCEPAVGQVFNVGSQHEIAVAELARRVLTTAGGESISDRIHYVPYADVYGEKFDDFPRRVPDNSKLRAFTGWVPRHGIDRMVEDVVSSLRGTVQVEGASGRYSA